MEKQTIIAKSKAWVERFVIGLQLCPFAKQPFGKGLIHFEVSFESETEPQLMDFWRQVEQLSKTPPQSISNTILIFPDGLTDFEKYLDFYSLAESLLAEQNLQEHFQLAGFHPDYQFENTEKNDASNYTNRSPFPFVHILRTAEVADAIENYPDIDNVPERNIRLLNEMGVDKIKAIINAI